MPCALAPATSDSLTRALETAVYLKMRRRASSRVGSIALLKLKSGKEIDFIEGDEAFGIAYELIQVSLNMENEATRQREVSALQEAMARFEKDAATIVTLEEESSINIPEGVIHVMPAWKWLLG
ncbi:ATP-binding protein [Senegalimassilia faecalis]|uniref:ATP-binding protein n=1 Tax=Senegalimassilia faecalis TaxID=2509433 RepID=A0A4Q2K3V2_9ACTN|nr:ATP-binding protein [Senegalimassilia faecalis]RXZ54433.1 ATP-binding protein [Senegalimassilia faecalis]